MDATAWATVWVFLALLVFLGTLVYMKVPAMLTAALDKRADKIRSELDEAQKLRREAEALLAEYKRRTANAEAEAAAIVTQAKREAEALSAEAKGRIEEYVARRTRAVEQRIAQAETQAVAEVRSRAIDVAAAAAGRILAERAKGKAGDELVERSIDVVRKNLN
ncbi:MAG: ATP F0F1 synthase subunit B [Propylenella sp.]